MFDLDKARKLMKRRDIDGSIVSSPENFYYVSDYAGIIFSGKGGTSTVIVPQDQNQDPAVVVMDWETPYVRRGTWIKDIRSFETWIHIDKEEPEPSSTTKPHRKPEQFDPLQVISQTLKEKGLERGNLGVELESVPHLYYERLKAAMPKANLFDITELLLEMRTIKTRTEIDKFRKAVMITEKAYTAVMKAAREGVTEREVAKEFRRVVAESDCWGAGYIQLGTGLNSGGPHSPFMDPADYKLKNGDLVRLDGGVNFQGIITDMCRTWVVGKPSEKQKRLHSALMQGQRKIVQALKPGMKFSELFKIGLEAVREAGYPHYTRGHLGHSISYGPFAEEPPFVSAMENRTLSPNMVLCIESPYYVTGFGGINIEDMVLITEDGHEELTKLDRDLRSLG